MNKEIKEMRIKTYIEQMLTNVDKLRVKGLAKHYIIKLSTTGKSCEICQETRYLEKCHIIPRYFDWWLNHFNILEANTLLLCPNCHKYFDKGILTDEEKAKIMPKVIQAVQIFCQMNNDKDKLAVPLPLKTYRIQNQWIKNLIQDN